MGRASCVFVFVLMLLACDSPGTSTDYSCEAHPDPHCAHPIDRLVIPRLRALGSGPRDASKSEVCRRMAIDLLGRAPTEIEHAHCRTQTFAEMATMFLGSEEAIRPQRRAWAELAKYESLLVWGRNIADLDALVAQLYRGELDYAEFVRRYIVHPAFYGLHPGDAWTANVFSIFLGRPARSDELAGVRPLIAPWSGRAFCAREVFWNRYQSELANGATEAAAVLAGNKVCAAAAKFDFGINLCKCKPGMLDPGCISDAFGTFVQLEPTCDSETSERSTTYYVGESTPSNDDLCPDNVTRRPECRDRGLQLQSDGTFAIVPLVERTALPASQYSQLRKIGDTLIDRGDLWEAAVDRELRKLLGWWQATFKHPDSDLPEVRALLAQRLRDGATMRDVIELIVTSQLYVQPAASPDGIDRTSLPPYAAGPSKLLAGESWLAAAASTLGETSGTCDFRWGQASEYAPHWTDPRLVESKPGTIDPRVPGPQPPHGYSIGAIQRLGGCRGDAKRIELSNVGLAFAQAAIARDLCAVARRVTPDGWNGDLRTAAAYGIGRVWTRDPSDEELETLVVEMEACLAAGRNSGCADHTIAARWLCQRLLDSVEFGTY